MPGVDERLNRLATKAVKLGNRSRLKGQQVRAAVEYVCRCLSNRAGVRLLMACLLAKLDRPEVDPRKPYTEIGGNDCFSGRTYDERYLSRFINDHRLPCNSTTAFLTPTLRNQNTPLTPDVDLVGRPREVYQHTLELLDLVAKGKFSAEEVMIETIRLLIVLRDEKQARMNELVSALNRSQGALPLSTESIITLLRQHLACKHSSRLPVLIVTAAYQAAGSQLGEWAKPLTAHHSAEEQSGARGDVEICLVNDDLVRTIYEMKGKRVSRDDVDRAIQKASRSCNAS